MPAFEIELITQDHHAELIAFWKTCEGICVSASDQADKFQQYLERNPLSNFLARHEGVIVGTSLAGHDGRRGTLRHVAVDKRYRGKGLGNLLIERCLSSLAAEGIERNYVIVLADNRAGLDFWSHNGWERLDDCRLFAKGKVA